MRREEAAQSPTDIGPTAARSSPSPSSSTDGGRGALHSSRGSSVAGSSLVEHTEAGGSVDGHVAAVDETRDDARTDSTSVAAGPQLVVSNGNAVRGGGGDEDREMSRRYANPYDYPPEASRIAIRGQRQRRRRTRRRGDDDIGNSDSDAGDVVMGVPVTGAAVDEGAAAVHDAERGATTAAGSMGDDAAVAAAWLAAHPQHPPPPPPEVPTPELVLLLRTFVAAKALRPPMVVEFIVTVIMATQLLYMLILLPLPPAIFAAARSYSPRLAAVAGVIFFPAVVAMRAIIAVSLQDGAGDASDNARLVWTVVIGIVVLGDLYAGIATVRFVMLVLRADQQTRDRLEAGYSPSAIDIDRVAAAERQGDAAEV